MTARLGNVLYWAACIFAALWLAMWLYVPTAQVRPEWGFGIGMGMIGGTVIWAVGRAILYVLAGR